MHNFVRQSVILDAMEMNLQNVIVDVGQMEFGVLVLAVLAFRKLLQIGLIMIKLQTLEEL
jgi:hypothetical protein